MTVPGWNGQVSEDVPSLLTPIAGGGNTLLVRQRVGVLNAQAKKGPETVRIALHPLQRVDRKPTNPAIAPIWVAVPGLRAGWRNTPAGPVPNPIATGNANLGFGTYVVITWGSGGAKPQQLLADWPVAGASVELTADQVTVDAYCGEEPGMPVPAASVGSEPRFAADLVPSRNRGRAERDALSYNQLAQAQEDTQVQAAVPEFASMLDIGLGDVLPAGGILDVTWVNADGGPVYEERHTVAPVVRRPVPEGALTVIVTPLLVGPVFDSTVWLHWRIAP